MRGRRLAELSLALVLVACARDARSQEDLYGRAILSYQTLDADVFRTNGFHQTYDLRLERAVSDAFRFRVSFRGEGNDGTSRFDDEGDVRTKFRQYQPGAEVLYTLPTVQFKGNYDDIRTTAETDALEDDRRLRRLYGVLTWRPEAFPTLTLYGEQRKRTSDAARQDDTENTVLEALDWTWKGLSLGQNARYQTLDDGGTDFARKSTDAQGYARYENNFFGGRATVSASVQGGLTRLDERSRSGQPVSVPLRVAIPHALYARDDTPLDGRDRPLQDTPALIDGDFQKPAGIPLGPDGTSYQNLAVDMGRVVQLDSFTVHVRDVDGHAVTSGGVVRFDAYRSDDGLTWVPLPGGSRTAFDVAATAYTVDFALTSARFFKIVSFGTNLLDTQVTEIEVFQHQTFGAGEVKRTDIRLGNATATIFGKPTDWLVLGYYGLLNTNRQTASTGTDFSTVDSDQIATAEVDPGKGFNLVGRYERRLTTQTNGLDQTLDALSAIGHWSPLRTIDVTAEYRRSKEDLAGRMSTSNGVSGHLYLKFLRSLDLSLDGSWNKEIQSSDDHPATRVNFTAISYAQLTDDLKLTTSASYQETSYANGTPDEIAAGLLLPASHDARYWGEVFYRPGPQLALTARLGYASSDLFSGLTQAYRVEWYPFGTGTVSIGTIYDEDLDSVSNRRFRRVQILPRWAVNRNTTIDLNFTVLSNYVTLAGTNQVVSTTNRSFWATLTLAF